MAVRAHPRSFALRRCGTAAVWVALALFTGWVGAQATPAGKTAGETARKTTEAAAHPVAKQRKAHGHAVRKRQEAQEAEPAPAPPKTPSEIAAVPAKVMLQHDDLTVSANNSELSEILSDVSHQTGMQVDGTAGNARVFGQYGPGNPRQVLTELLAGTGVNFVMVGDTQAGTPRELVLTAQTGGGAEPGAAGGGMGRTGGRGGIPGAAANAGQQQGGRGALQEQRQNQNGQGQSDQDQNEQGQGDQGAGDQEPLGPGAVPYEPPQPTQDTQTRVQQNLQRLEQQRQQVEQQQQQNSPQ